MARTYHLGPTRRAGNLVITALIRAGTGGRANYLLTTVGRRTGQSRTTPVTLVENADGRWLVSPYGNVGWVYNVRAHPQVTLRQGQRTEVARAEEAVPRWPARCSSSTWGGSGSRRRSLTRPPRTRWRRSCRRPPGIRCSG